MGSARTYLQLFNHGRAFHLDLGNGASIWRPLLQNNMKHENVTVKQVRKTKYNKGRKLGRDKQKLLVGKQMKLHVVFPHKSFFFFVPDPLLLLLSSHPRARYMYPSSGGKGMLSEMSELGDV